MHRQMIIAGNWKMFKTFQEALELSRKVKFRFMSEKDVEILLCPPFPFLYPISEIIKGSKIKLGAQNMHWEEQGAFTGEVSAKMLLTSGANFVIIGHSERRSIFGETDETVNKKVNKALLSGLTPIMCIGETLDERRANKTLDILKRQLTYGLQGIELKSPTDMIIAYEPVWAIGTGINAKPEEAQESHKFIRDWLKQRYNQNIADGLRIQYGGSLKPDNASEIFKMVDIDGGLIGGASLDAESFASIIQSAKEAKC